MKNSNKYYDDCARILGNMVLRELAPLLGIPWTMPFQLDDPPFVPTTFGKMYVASPKTLLQFIRIITNIFIDLNL